MKPSTRLYPNISRFLESLGFKITVINVHEINFTFKDTDLSKSFDEFNNAMEEAQDIEDENLQDEEYKKAWDDWNIVQQKYYPKLQKILDSLDIFYTNRHTSLDFKIYFDNEDLTNLKLTYNKLIKKVHNNKQEFDSKFESELADFDNFLLNNLNQ